MPDMSLDHFIEHIGRAHVHIKESEHEALERAAELLERRAKANLGTYQAGAGPFADWQELADRTKDDRVQQGFTENDPGERSGAMRDSIHHVVGDREAVVGSDDPHMEYFELGTDTQPPRSDLGLAAVQTGPEIARIIGRGVVSGLVGRGVAGGRLPI